MKGLVGLIIFVAVLFAVVVSGNLRAADAPLFQKGQTYNVVWDCTPEWMSQYMSQMAAGGQPLNPCYSETLTVQVVRADGWLQVRDEGGQTWMVNAARMIGMQIRAQSRAAD